MIENLFNLMNMTTSEPTSLIALLRPQDEESLSLTEGYDEHFDPPLSNVYECPICLLMLRMAVQTDCGHRFCRGCIMKTLSEGRKCCPVDNLPLKEEEIFPDMFARREVLRANVRCRNYAEHECPWIGMLADIEHHMKECPHQLVECENKCGTDVQRKDMESHLLNDCPKRVVSCQYCDITVVFEKLEDHNSRCTKFPIICPKYCSSNTFPREELDQHLEYYCPKMEISCPFEQFGCPFKGSRSACLDHLKTMAIKHTAELVDVVKKTADATEKRNKATLDLSSSSSEELLVKIVQMSEQVEAMKSKVSQVDDVSNQAHRLLEAYSLHTKQRFEKLQDDLVVITKKVDLHDNVVNEVQAKMWCGRFIWKISNFEGLFQEAKSGAIPAIHSPPFYSGIPGYKVCIRVNLNGVDAGAKTHVSMFVHMMQGDFDAILPWPFSGEIILTVIDQSEGERLHVSEALVAKPGLQAFLRPRSARNHKGYGYVQMVRHQTLRSREYIKNDVMIIEVNVKTKLE